MALLMNLSIAVLLLTLVTTATFIATRRLPFDQRSGELEALPPSHSPLSKKAATTQSGS
jgi:hypothetical protein